ncbi:MAG: hypothetical protein ACXVYB_17320, partial [Arthrobacter sp.]
RKKAQCMSPEFVGGLIMPELVRIFPTSSRLRPKDEKLEFRPRFGLDLFIDSWTLEGQRVMTVHSVSAKSGRNFIAKTHWALCGVWCFLRAVEVFDDDVGVQGDDLSADRTGAPRTLQAGGVP